MIMPANTSTICVVDPHPDDYSELVNSATGDGTRIQFMKSARDALRYRSDQAPELWVINVDLPDMSGSDLHSMIRSRFPGVPFYLVGDGYRAEDEIAARSCGATMYFCKPLQSEWLLATPMEAPQETPSDTVN
jgi:DNA-binding response OmpR family regulator